MTEQADIEEREKWEPRAGEMHDIDRAFYNLAVEQRDRAWEYNERLEEELRTAYFRIDVLDAKLEKVREILSEAQQ